MDGEGWELNERLAPCYIAAAVKDGADRGKGMLGGSKSQVDSIC